MRLINLIVGLFLLLPWWAALGVLGALVIGLVLYAKHLFSRMVRNVTDEIVAQGTPLTDAVVSIHSVQRTGVPEQPSPFDSDPEDEDYDPDLDGNWSAEDGEFFLVDATIAPQQPDAVWMPGNLSLIRADFEPQEPLEACMEVALLHRSKPLRNCCSHSSANVLRSRPLLAPGGPVGKRTAGSSRAARRSPVQGRTSCDDMRDRIPFSRIGSGL